MADLQKTYFLDMGVIVGYLVFTDSKPELDVFAAESTKFINKNKNMPIVTCCSIMVVDLPKFMGRWNVMSKEIRKKLRDSTYQISQSNLLPRDVKRAEKIYSLAKKIGKEKLNQKLVELEVIIEIRRDSLLTNNIINEVVIPVDEIDSELQSHFQAVTGNYSDSRVIASAIQYTTKINKNTIVVTTDYTDFKDIKEQLESRDIFEPYLCPGIYFIKIRR